MSEPSTQMPITPPQETLVRLWEEHIPHEFETRNTDDTLATMVEDAYVDHVPVLTGGCGKAELRDFYATQDPHSSSQSADRAHIRLTARLHTFRREAKSHRYQGWHS